MGKDLELRHGKLISSLTIRLKGTQLPKKSSTPENEGRCPKIDHAHFGQWEFLAKRPKFHRNRILSSHRNAACVNRVFRGRGA